MKKIFIASVAIGAIALAVMAFRPASVQPLSSVTPESPKAFAGKWALDKVHSNVKFTITHMVVSDVDGSFKLFDGSMEHSKPDYSDEIGRAHV